MWPVWQETRIAAWAPIRPHERRISLNSNQKATAEEANRTENNGATTNRNQIQLIQEHLLPDVAKPVEVPS